MKAACEDCSCVQSYPHAKHDVHAPQSEALIATGKELPFARHFEPLPGLPGCVAACFCQVRELELGLKARAGQELFFKNMAVSGRCMAHLSKPIIVDLAQVATKCLPHDLPASSYCIFIGMC